jgi:hypothetical protein
MRNISFALTTAQFLDGSKDVTRRMGWQFLRPGDTLMAVEKSQGLGKGGKIKRFGVILVVDVRREPLRALTDRDDGYGFEEVRREGFPCCSPPMFVSFFCRSHKGCTPDSVVTRIAFARGAQ